MPTDVHRSACLLTCCAMLALCPTALAAKANPRKNKAPNVSIASPADGSSFVPGTAISFSGSAVDNTDGDLTAQLVWTSSLVGVIGTGGDFSAVLEEGAHTIAASVTDSGGKTGSASINITGDTPPGEVTPYTYDQATVILDYRYRDQTLVGTLSGANLKPNFAYQIKLNGKPTAFWGVDGDDVANESLGYAGRWWRHKINLSDPNDVTGSNSSDADYDFWKAKDFTDGDYQYVFEGYLLFDYAVTDVTGTFSKPLALNSSFHVLWRTSQRTPAPEDSAPATYIVVADSGSEWYDLDSTSTVQLYAEWEPGRALPDTLLMPVGAYNVRMFLTEESFHESSLEGGGSWATVLTLDDLNFEFSDTQPPSETITSAQLSPVDWGDQQRWRDIAGTKYASGKEPNPADQISLGGSFWALDTTIAGRYDITAMVSNGGTSSVTVTIDCTVSDARGRTQALESKTVALGPGAVDEVVYWTDSVSRKFKPGTHTATVTVAETGESSSTTFYILK